jgi:cyclic lactone autoinducer peptide
MKKITKANFAAFVSSILSVIAALIVTPYSVGLVHQPKAPKELYKK